MDAKYLKNTSKYHANDLPLVSNNPNNLVSEFLVRESACFHLLIFEKMSYFLFIVCFFTIT